jgi:hypothetical protein
MINHSVGDCWNILLFVGCLPTKFGRHYYQKSRMNQPFPATGRSDPYDGQPSPESSHVSWFSPFSI